MSMSIWKDSTPCRCTCLTRGCVCTNHVNHEFETCTQCRLYRHVYRREVARRPRARRAVEREPSRPSEYHLVAEDGRRYRMAYDGTNAREYEPAPDAEDGRG